MSWSPVNSKYRKPIAWWWYKIVCEVAWLRRKKDGYTSYNKYLDKLCSYGYNL